MSHWDVSSTILFLMVINCAASAFIGSPLHMRLDPDRLQQIFHVDSYEEIPEYEVVEIRTLSKRSVDDNEVEDVQLSAFGKDIRLHLRRNRGFDTRLKHATMYMADMTDDGIKYTEVKEEVDNLDETYQDVDKMAAITIRRGASGRIQMEGTIGDSIVVKPVPRDILVPASDDKDHSFEGVQTNSTNFPKGFATRRDPHFIIHCTRGNATKELIPLSEFYVENSRLPTVRTRSKRSPIHSAFPEVLLMADYDMYAANDFSEIKTRKYLASFLNGVDLRFKTLSNPKIELTLTSIIIAKSRDATPYLQNNPKLFRSFDGSSALHDMAKHMFSARRRLPKHDLALLLTKRDICSLDKQSGKCDPRTAGIAYLGGACHVVQENQRADNVGIAEDNGGFDGILTAAHEIAHLLGVDHDGLPPSSILGGPGSSRCSSVGGYIMSLVELEGRRFHWSSCSIEQLRHFLSTPRAFCLFNKPESNLLAGSPWPGQMQTLDEQCRRDGGIGACQRDSRVCSQLHCYSATGHCYAGQPAADGSPCGKARICYNGHCVATGSSRQQGNSFNSIKVCKDNDSGLMGGLTCRQYLQIYSFACKTNLAKKNCCHSYSLLC